MDDYTGHPQSFGAKTKDRAFDIVCGWVARTESKYGFKVGTIPVDNSELKSGNFDSWCVNLGITVDYMASHTSAHDGQGEHIHLTLENLAQIMCIDCGLLEFLWDKSKATAAYLQACVPSKGSKQDTI